MYVILLFINVDCFIVHYLVIASVLIIKWCDAETSMKLLHANLTLIFFFFAFSLLLKIVSKENEKCLKLLR